MLLKLINKQNKPLSITIKDQGYGKAAVKKKIPASGTAELVLDLKKSHGWYDFSVLADGLDAFEERYAGRVETGVESFSDPVMGGIL